MRKAIAILGAVMLATVAPSQMMVSSLVDMTGGTVDTLQYAVPTSGQTVQIIDGKAALVLNPAGLLATLTVTLPANPVDGERILITSSAIITLLTVNGGTVKGLVTGLAVNGYARYMYSADAAAWFRTG